MAKRRKQIPEFPPEVFWMAPNGVVIEGIGHLSMLRASPEEFGLPAPPRSRAEIDTAIGQLLEDGWIRGRYSLPDEILYLQIGVPTRTNIGNAYDLVLQHQDTIDRIAVDSTWPRMESWDFRTEDFLDGRFPRKWRINPKLRRRKGHS